MKGKCSDRIKEALNLRNMKPIELVERSGVKKSALSQYMSGKITPRQKSLDSMAKVLNVSPAWLMGFDVPMEREDILKNNKFQEKIINEDTNVDLKGEFTITENIKGEYIRILNVSNDNTANERIYDLKTNKYNEKKINNIIISFCMENEDYTTEDTYKFIKLFKEYKKLSDDKQKEVENIISRKKIESKSFNNSIVKYYKGNDDFETKYLSKLYKYQDYKTITYFYFKKNYLNFIDGNSEIYIVKIDNSKASNTENFLKENLPAAMIEKINSDNLNSDRLKK
ncbi:helix-turn-helix domain-containing protein [Fusobacterium animalis]|uniref:helix-turn-helix domain-containing protein n=1 Tax=Fusobacterium animalis TaxID=76859 RepID=UPI0030CFCD9A